MTKWLTFKVGIDNSKIYKASGREAVDYDLFSKSRLDYLFSNNYIKEAINKLAYYNLKKWEFDYI